MEIEARNRWRVFLPLGNAQRNDTLLCGGICRRTEPIQVCRSFQTRDFLDFFLFSEIFRKHDSWLPNDTNPVPYIEHVGSFGQSQNVTGRIMATTANCDRPWQKLFWAYSRIRFSDQKNTRSESSTWLLTNIKSLRMFSEDLSELFGVTEWPHLFDVRDRVSRPVVMAIALQWFVCLESYN